MQNIFVFTAANKAAQAHLKDTIENPISDSVLRRFLNESDYKAVSEKLGNVYAWGATPGQNNLRNFQLMNEGDLVVAYYHKQYHFFSKVAHKCVNKDLAKHLWGTDPENRTWEHMYFFGQPIWIAPPIPANSLSKYLPSSYMGFSKISDHKITSILNDFGTLERFINVHFKGMEMTNKENSISRKIKTQIDFKEELARYFNAIQTKPFILLAGISGTGKSRLVRKLAYKTCYLDELRDDHRPGNFELIPVLPNWHDSSELIGYESRLSGKLEYKVTTFLRFLAKAHRYPQIPFFLCLDEMNLAPVEQYFAEYLSIIETRTYQDSEMITDSFISAANLNRYADAMGEQFWIDLGISDDQALQNKFLQHGIQLSANLVVMGTVNMDETTHSFSRKVLDRAMTIEMNEVNFMDDLETAINDLAYPDEYYHPSLVFGNFQGGQMAFQSLGKVGKIIIQQLEDLNKILEGTPFKLAYRVRDELLVYCYHGSKQTNPPKNWVNRCMDEILDMKLLPRIEGDKGRCERVIDDLIAKLPADFENCHLKLKTMKEKLESQGFTSYWD